jgi:zinc transport system ATP-binding protein
MNKSHVTFTDISFAYTHTPVLQDISFDIGQGDYVGLVGGNGSGKTTLLRIMLGLLLPQTGVVTLFGKESEQFDQWSLIGYVPQHVSRGEASFGSTVREVVESGLVSKKRHWISLSPDDESAIQWALDVTHTDVLKDRMIHELSGGERQLIFIARALVSRPKLLVLDEPTTGVDAYAQERFYSLLSVLNKTHGITIVLVSHDLEVVAREVKTVICVNRSLVCNVSSKEFIEGDYLKRIYGEDMKYIHHTHNH